MSITGGGILPVEMEYLVKSTTVFRLEIMNKKIRYMMNTEENRPNKNLNWYRFRLAK